MSCTILPTRTVEKMWGVDRLPRPFETPAGKRVGEIWFEPPPQYRELLVKYIFAGEKLSIQTHPDDDQAEAAGLGRQGKEECWLVIDAQPGATLGIGFAEYVEPQRMRAAALDGSIEDMLVWHQVSAGDFFYIPANTVHAIGGGVSLIEVQQNSDITYRLYDYGRPRELHLEDGIRVASGEVYPDRLRGGLPADGPCRLVGGPYFELDWITGEAGDGERTGSYLLVPVSGECQVDGQNVYAGQCALVENPCDVQFGENSRNLIARAI